MQTESEHLKAFEDGIKDGLAQTSEHAERWRSRSPDLWAEYLSGETNGIWDRQWREYQAVERASVFKSAHSDQHSRHFPTSLDSAPAFI